MRNVTTMWSSQCPQSDNNDKCTVNHWLMAGSSESGFARETKTMHCLDWVWFMNHQNPLKPIIDDHWPVGIRPITALLKGKLCYIVSKCAPVVNLDCWHQLCERENHQPPLSRKILKCVSEERGGLEIDTRAPTHIHLSIDARRVNSDCQILANSVSRRRRGSIPTTLLLKFKPR